MNKKLLTTILLFIVLLLTSVSCYANDNSNFETEMQDSANKSQTTIQNAGEGIRNVASDIGSGVQGAAQSIGNGIQDMFDGNDNGNNGDNNEGTGTVTNSDNEAVGMVGTDMGDAGDYTATRTATDRITGTTMTNTAWVWLILGIVGVAIVALTWYYVSQHSDRH